jgi:hypothetical protein
MMERLEPKEKKENKDFADQQDHVDLKGQRVHQDHLD